MLTIRDINNVLVDLQITLSSRATVLAGPVLRASGEVFLPLDGALGIEFAVIRHRYSQPDAVTTGRKTPSTSDEESERRCLS